MFYDIDIRGDEESAVVEANATIDGKEVSFMVWGPKINCQCSIDQVLQEYISVDSRDEEHIAGSKYEVYYKELRKILFDKYDFVEPKPKGRRSSAMSAPRNPFKH